jgi:anti-sigma B factor antagonist
MDFHAADPTQREEVMRRYLYRCLSADQMERLEEHYLSCDECFEELRATELLIRALNAPVVRSRRVNDVYVLAFPENTHLLAESVSLHELARVVRLQSESKVLIDLSKVSRIDSTGLGMLMNCYCHALKNSGALKLLSPKAHVKNVLSVTRIDSVLETFEDEESAIDSFAG